MIVDEYGALAKSIDFTKLVVDYFSISMETNGVDESWINENIEIHNRSIHNMVISGLIDSNKNVKKWFCVADTSEELYMQFLHCNRQYLTSFCMVW